MVSFNGNKILTTAAGGALLANDPALVARARHLATQARMPAPHYEHHEAGFNYRMPNLLASVGLGQLERLPEMIRRRGQIAERYRIAFAGLPGISPMPVPVGSDPNNWLSVVTIDQAVAGVDRTAIYEALAAANIESRPAWKPMHQQPAFAGCETIGGAVSDRVFATGLCLPSGSAMSAADIGRVTDVVLDQFTRQVLPVD